MSILRKDWHQGYILVAILLASLSANSQNYQFEAYTRPYEPLVGGTPAFSVNMMNPISDPLPIGFTFDYFGTSYTQFKVSENGFITFNMSSGSIPENDIFFQPSWYYVPPENIGNQLIAPLWDDMMPGSVGQIRGQVTYRTTGFSPNRKLIVEWLNWRYTDHPALVMSNISFQVILFESSNRIEFCYRREADPILINTTSSIGLINVPGQFYSLSDGGPSPALDQNGYDAINIPPATAQLYAFTPIPPIVEPEIPASGINVAFTGDSKVNIGWINGNGSYRAVFVKRTTSETDFFPATDGQYYIPSDQFPVSEGASDWYCVYNGSGNSVTLQSVTNVESLRIHVIEYNGIGGNQVYAKTINQGNPITVVPPTAYWGWGLRLNPTSGTEALLGFLSSRTCSVFIKAGDTDSGPPLENNVLYSPNTSFGAGTQVGSSGWYCVSNGYPVGGSPDFIVTNLSPDTKYSLWIVATNGIQTGMIYSSSFQSYSFTTKKVPKINYAFEAALGSFSPLQQANEINNVVIQTRLERYWDGQNWDWLEIREKITTPITKYGIKSDPIQLDFPFTFAGQTYQQVESVLSNGLLSFRSNTSVASENNLSETFLRPSIAPLWDDNGGGSKASYVTAGITPNRITTFEFLNWKWSHMADSSISFQVRLYEVDNSIEFIYQQEHGLLINPSASIGLALLNMNEFISVSNVTGPITASSTLENSTISEKPISGQIFRFTPIKLDQSISFAIADKSMSPKPFELNALSDSGLPITYTSSDTNVVKVSGNFATTVGLGSVTLTATQAGDANYNPAETVQQTFNVVKGSQEIEFSEPGEIGYSNEPYILDAKSNTGLPLVFSSSNPSVASISGSSLTILAQGTTEITASQSGNDLYYAAQATRVLTIVKGKQTITFNNLPFFNNKDFTFNLTATSSSGLPLSFISSNPEIASVSGNTLVLSGVFGKSMITASQEGDDNYLPADDITQPLYMRMPQTIVMDDISDKLISDLPFKIIASSNSNLPITFSSSSHISINNGTHAQLLMNGHGVITASQGGSNEYEPAVSVEKSFCIFIPTFEIKVTQETVSQEPGWLYLDSDLIWDYAPTGIQWYLNGVAIEGATQETYFPETSGSYSASSTVEGCTQFFDAINIGITAVETLEAGIKIYPNPTENEITVDLSVFSSSESTISIHDLVGRKLMEVNDNGIIKLNLLSLSSGQYLLTIKNNNQFISKLILKK